MPQPVDPNVEYRRGLVYGVANGHELLLNAAIPARGERPFPAVVLIHGAWSKRPLDGWDHWMARFAGQGFVAVAIRYRYLPEHHFPAQVEDIKCAVRYLRANANDLKIDPHHIGAMGYSAGGHLALMLGIVGEDAGLEGSGGYPEFSSRIQAVVNFYGPTDMNLARDEYEDGSYYAFMGWPESRADPVFRLASPITYVSADDPPILTFHGTLDGTVPYEHARRLDDVCLRVGARHELVTMYETAHAMPAWTIEPVMNFFHHHLKGLGASAGLNPEEAIRMINPPTKAD
jgi:acetyl esterase/lipase